MIQEANLNVENQIAVKKMVSPVVGNVNPVAIRRNHVKRVIVKNRSPAQRKILPAKKKKNPAPIKKRTVQRVGVNKYFFVFQLHKSNYIPFSLKP